MYVSFLNFFLCHIVFGNTIMKEHYFSVTVLPKSLNDNLPKGSWKIIESIYGSICSFVVCPEGSYLNSQDNGACTICPVNTYSTATDSNMCSNCPLGTNTQELTGRTSFNACGKRRIIFKYDSGRNVYYIILPVYCEIPRLNDLCKIN